MNVTITASKKSTRKADFSALLEDDTPCFEIDTSTAAHELGELARLDGHASLTSLLNDWRAWGMTVAEVAEILLTADE